MAEKITYEFISASKYKKLNVIEAKLVEEEEREQHPHM